MYKESNGYTNCVGRQSSSCFMVGDNITMWNFVTKSKNICSTWQWRQYNPLKCQWKRVTSQERCIFSNTACKTVSHTATNKSCCTEAQNSLPLHTTLLKQVLQNIILKFQDARCAYLVYRSMESTGLPAPNVHFAILKSNSHKHHHENDSTLGILWRK